MFIILGFGLVVMGLILWFAFDALDKADMARRERKVQEQIRIRRYGKHGRRP